MHRTRKRMMLLPCTGFLVLMLATGGPSHAAETFSMQLPPAPAFHYRVTSTNQLVKPGPITLRFSRTEDGSFCSKVNQVGVNIGSPKNFPGGLPPGMFIYTSAISNGAALCNFGYDDTMVPLAFPPWTDESVTRYAKSWCIDDLLPPWPDPGDTGNWSLTQKIRRETKTNSVFGAPFRPFLRKNNGQYEWKVVTSPSSDVKCDTQAPFLCWVKADLTCDPVAGPNRPPVFEKVSLSPWSTAWSEIVPAEGGTLTVHVIAYDDVGVYDVRGGLTIGTGSPIPFSLRRLGGLDRTAGGDNRSSWQGTITIPPNSTYFARTNTFTLELYDLEGGTLQEGGKSLKTVVPASSTKPIQQAALPDAFPPKILSFSATPLTLPATGGAVTVSLRAWDNIGVRSVQLTLVYPNGQSAPLQMSLVSGTATDGEWRTGWNMWANTETTQKAYTVKATVKDANNTVSSQLLQLTVAAAQYRLPQQTTGPMLPGTTTKTVDPGPLPIR